MNDCVFYQAGSRNYEREGLERKPRRERSERGVAAESPTRSVAKGHAQSIEHNRTFVLPYDHGTYTFSMQFEYGTWNRIKRIAYPDREEVTYSYDRGGMLREMTGQKNGERFRKTLFRL